MIRHVADSTVTTLSDWYHVAASLGSRFPYVSRLHSRPQILTLYCQDGGRLDAH